MPETYFTFAPSWMQQTDGVKQRLGIKPMTEKEIIRAQEVAKELDNPGYFEQLQNGRYPIKGMVEKNPGLQTMGEAIDPSALYFVPGIGDALLAGETVYDAATGDYAGATLNAALLAAPSAIAGVGKTAKASKAVTSKAKLAKMPKDQAQLMYNDLMREQTRLMGHLDKAERNWRTDLSQVIKEKINVINQKIRSLSEAGHNFTGYVDNMAPTGIKPNQQYAQALDGTVGYELKPRLKSKAKAKKAAETAAKSEPKAMSEIEIMAKDKANKVQIAVDNRKYAKAGRKYDNSGAARKRSDYETTGRKNIREGKDAYGNRRGTQYHDIENYNLGYRWDYKTGLQGNVNRLKKHLAEKHSDLVYHEESLFKYLENNFPEQFKEASKKASGR